MSWKESAHRWRNFGLVTESKFYVLATLRSLTRTTLHNNLTKSICCWKIIRELHCNRCLKHYTGFFRMNWCRTKLKLTNTERYPSRKRDNLLDCLMLFSSTSNATNTKNRKIDLSRYWVISNTQPASILPSYSKLPQEMRRITYYLGWQSIEDKLITVATIMLSWILQLTPTSPIGSNSTIASCIFHPKRQP